MNSAVQHFKAALTAQRADELIALKRQNAAMRATIALLDFYADEAAESVKKLGAAFEAEADKVRQFVIDKGLAGLDGVRNITVRNATYIAAIYRRWEKEKQLERNKPYYYAQS